MSNLLNETIKVLKANGKTEEDVLWCGAEEFGYFDWTDFKTLANVEYDEGFGGSEVAIELIVVGADFWLERHEYDGSEWWEFKSMPVKPLCKVIPETLFCASYESLTPASKEQRE